MSPLLSPLHTNLFDSGHVASDERSVRVVADVLEERAKTAYGASSMHILQVCNVGSLFSSISLS